MILVLSSRFNARYKIGLGDMAISQSQLEYLFDIHIYYDNIPDVCMIIRKIFKMVINMFHCYALHLTKTIKVLR